MDEDWKLNSITLDFKGFPIPHKGYNRRVFLRSVLHEWVISSDIQCIKTENASDICKVIRLLFNQLQADFPDQYTTFEEFHVRCIVHVINLRVQEFISSLDDDIRQIRTAINAIKVSLKRRDVLQRSAERN